MCVVQEWSLSAYRTASIKYPVTKFLNGQSSLSRYGLQINCGVPGTQGKLPYRKLVCLGSVGKNRADIEIIPKASKLVAAIVILVEHQSFIDTGAHFVRQQHSQLQDFPVETRLRCSNLLVGIICRRQHREQRCLKFNRT